MRWAALLQENQCTIVYGPGETNDVADTLSKMFERDDCQGAPEEMTLQQTSPAKSQEVGGDVGVSPTVNRPHPGGVARNRKTKGRGQCPCF